MLRCGIRRHFQVGWDTYQHVLNVHSLCGLCAIARDETRRKLLCTQRAVWWEDQGSTVDVELFSDAVCQHSWLCQALVSSSLDRLGVRCDPNEVVPILQLITSLGTTGEGTSCGPDNLSSNCQEP